MVSEKWRLECTLWATWKGHQRHDWACDRLYEHTLWVSSPKEQQGASTMIIPGSPVTCKRCWMWKRWCSGRETGSNWGVYKNVWKRIYEQAKRCTGKSWKTNFRWIKNVTGFKGKGDQTDGSLDRASELDIFSIVRIISPFLQLHISHSLPVTTASLSQLYSVVLHLSHGS